MSDTSLDVLDERLDTLIKKVDEHTKEDDENFKDVFKLIKRVEITQAKNGVYFVGIILIGNMIIGAWIKGFFG